MNNDRFKYRVWHKEGKRYVTGNFSISPSGHLHKICGDEDGVYEIELDTQVFAVEQCTGLRDKNGKLIYEGDVLFDGNYVSFLVIWESGCFGYDYHGFHPIPDWIKDMAIVGNIHEEDK